jgi:hypothetical protein
MRKPRNLSIKQEPHSASGGSARQKLAKRILDRRDSIETRLGVLPDSYPLIREDRER